MDDQEEKQALTASLTELLLGCAANRIAELEAQLARSLGCSATFEHEAANDPDSDPNPRDPHADRRNPSKMTTAGDFAQTDVFAQISAKFSPRRSSKINYLPTTRWKHVSGARQPAIRGSASAAGRRPAAGSG